MRLGTDPHQFNRNVQAGLQAAGASGLLMLAAWLQIALCILAIQLTWRSVRWVVSCVSRKRCPTGSSRRSAQ